MFNPSYIFELVINKFPRFGVNKNREILRLVYEIAKRDGVLPEQVLLEISSQKFEAVKNELLKIRYPQNYGAVKTEQFYLPKLDISANATVEVCQVMPTPEKIYYENGLQESIQLSNAKSAYPNAVVEKINSIKEFTKNCINSFEKYNQRAKSLFLVSEKYDFFKPCPCTKDAFCCGYEILNIGFGCAFECSYCFLQEYQNFPGIILPVNLQDHLPAISKTKFSGNIFGKRRVGSGQFTDSLIFDHISEFSKTITEYFHKTPETFFEFKTKSNNIKKLLDAKAAKNIVVSWSLNPQKLIDENEFYTASLRSRLEAAKECVKAGYSVGFHFDPVIKFTNWEVEYKKVIEQITATVPIESILWLSVGTLRMTPQLKKAIENRFPKNKILDEELLLGYDGKLRYNQSVREEIYKKFGVWCAKYLPKTYPYLCMEEKSVWDKTGFKY